MSAKQQGATQLLISRIKNTRKDIVIDVLLVVFILISIFNAVLSVKKTTSHEGVSYHDVTLVETQDGLYIRKDYVDDDGNVIKPADRWYATVVYEYDGVADDKHVLCESYYLEDGSVAYSDQKYCKVIYEYSDDYLTRTAFFVNENDELVERTDGYSIYVRKYFRKGLSDHTDMYYDKNNKPVANTSEAYGITRYYEGDNNTEIVWLDKEGNPVECSAGYSRLVREYDDEKRIIREFYYDLNGDPATLSNGWSAVYNIYYDNGLKKSMYGIDSSTLEYSANDQGYYGIEYVYRKDGSIYKQLYVDASGNPCHDNKYYYGTRLDGERTYYLDKNGNDVFSIDSLIDNNPYVVIIAAVVISILFYVLPVKVRIPLLALYFLFIMYETIFFRIMGDTKVRLELFWSYRQFFTDKSLRLEILNNIWLFIPYGLGIASVVSKRKALILLMLLPLTIEAMQGVLGLGLCETDDLISNYLGILIGVLVLKSIRRYVNAKAST